MYANDLERQYQPERNHPHRGGAKRGPKWPKNACIWAPKLPGRLDTYSRK